MSKYDNAPVWSIPKANQPKIMHHDNPGPGKYPISRDLNSGVTIAVSGRNQPVPGTAQDQNPGVGPGKYYSGYSSLTKNGILFKGGKFVAASTTYAN
jgi:hypothetical protein